MKIEKPGPPPPKRTKKTRRNPQKRWLEPPELKHCRRCDRTTNTECYRHLETFRKFFGGKGWALKVHDKLTAWLCYECDQVMSTKPNKTDLLAVFKHAEEWNFLIIKTWLI
jgi:hypothetical protein